MAHNPYAPSAASLQGASREGFRDLSGISRALSILLLFGAAISLFEVVGWLGELLGQRMSGAPTAAMAMTFGAIALLSLLNVLLYIITAVIFLRWVYLAHKNLRDLGGRYLSCSPGWAVGSFFIPVISLWAPYQAMRDLAKASRSPARWDLEDTPPLVVGWWALWLLEGLAYSLRNGMRLSLQVQEGIDLNLVQSLVAVPLYLLALLVIRRIWRDQARQQAQLLQPPGVA
jgi:uncharacterized membrane protein